MFVVAVEFNIKEEHVDAFRERVLQQAADSLENEAACHQFDVCVNAEHASKFFLYEVYDDAAAFEAHRQTEYFAEFANTVADWVAAKTLHTLNRIS
jgi:quinol monooxygenase YgiN